jgi:signal transduction histidine kinase/CheY-like chemotaxis protein
MTVDSGKTASPGRTRLPPPGFQTSLRARLRISAFIGIAILGAWLAFTINAVFSLYGVTLTIQRTTDLRERVQDAQAGLAEAEDALDRYILSGQGYDLSRHNSGRTTLHMALGAMSRRVMTESARGIVQRAESAEEIYARAADAALKAYRPAQPVAAREQRDSYAAPTAEKLREVLSELQLLFSRTESMAAERLKNSRDAAAMALAIMAGLILAGILWFLFDVNRRILVPCGAAAKALGDLVADRAPARLFDQSDDEIGELGRNFNQAAVIHAERARALAERDIQTSVNAVLTAAATVNDLAGFGSKVLSEILAVSGASSGVLYLPRPDGKFEPAVSLGGSEAENAVGREEARRAAEDRKTVFVAVDPQTPTINLYDGRILPRQSLTIPLVYFDHVVGVLSLGAAHAFTVPARNALSAIAPSLAVALANASANERVAEQSRRLAEQNELLEEQRSRIARTARELQRASELKDRFLASVSHELRTPMTVILGFTGALLRGGQGQLTPQQKESLERVQRNARMLLRLINDVLDISKIEAGKMEVSPQTVEVAALLRQVGADFSEAAIRKGLKLETSAAPGLRTVTSDPARLTQLLGNLVGNALKFTDNGSIAVRAEPRGEDRWALIVADTGIGVPPEEQEAIFEEFRQGEPQEHRGRGGTGLGLAISRKLAQALGGSIELESEPGKGSRFTVLLPRVPREEPKEAAAGAVPFVSREPGQKTILVVDDDEGVRELLAFELKPHGVRVLQAADGSAGLAIARREKPDAILLDVLMPNLDGWQTLRALKNNPETSEIPVVIVSVVENRAFGVSLGAFDHLVKPVDRTALLLTLSRAGALATRGPILVVDDDPDVRRLLENELVSAGYRVRTAAGGAEALEAIHRERPAAMLLDLAMPPPDGFEVLYRIRQDAALRDLPVIVITARELSSSEREALERSASRVLLKGSDASLLVEEILRAIEGESVGAT